MLDSSSTDSLSPEIAAPSVEQSTVIGDTVASDNDAVTSDHASMLGQSVQSILSSLSSEMTEKQAEKLSPIALAYIGDAVFELYVRSQLLSPPKRIRDYHQQVVSKVKAEQQSRYVDILSEHLTDSEKDILRRGRNATTRRHRRVKGQDYQKATGLEALIGFLYLSNVPRLLALLNRLDICDT